MLFCPRGIRIVLQVIIWSESSYDSLQAFSSSIAGMLASRAVLEGIGVGDSQASPTQALLLSVLQESLGRIATIIFAHRLGSSLEPECKMYRLLADIFNDSAMILACLSPALPKSLRVAVLAVASTLRSLCGVAAGSSKASLSAHFAKVGNLGELNAKDSSQETIISLLGMLTGSLVISHITTKFATWASLILLLSIHLFTNYLAVRAVSMRTLNRQRANLVFSSYLHAVKNKDVGLKLLTPEEVSHQERIFEKDGVLRSSDFRLGRNDIRGHCSIGVPLQKILSLFNRRVLHVEIAPSPRLSEFPALLDVYKNEGYIMMCSIIAGMRPAYYIVVKEGAENRDLLKGWLHALYHTTLWTVGRKEGESVIEGLERTRREVEGLLETYNVFEELERVGWDINTGALETRSGTRVRIG
ncbi:hypothetical protein HYFRA_00009582 [Hymenoscyphus fraxineus]|uniref:Protein root UVB sensitive/RUS domain-containing protein n=1 Tax=Hymenoscyphus fraxineus TaxID=746836 RepID=A0A9N9PUH5_9HELO|nr:hypothetical protein HYFRA_00009582 [Hymenoscyphus fraxineus]